MAIRKANRIRNKATRRVETVQAKDCYNPRDYIMVHKDHYQRLLEATQTRIEIAPIKLHPDQCGVCGGFHGVNMPCPTLAPMCSAGDTGEEAMKCDISKIFDRRMFEDIQQLNAGPDRQGLAEITCRRTLVRLHQTAWDYADALLLRDWLNRAFPADGGDEHEG
jgi:hypothetical protein